MFSGIVQEKGNIKEIVSGNNIVTICIQCTEDFQKDVKEGDSVAVDGTCLTITKINKGELYFDLVEETVSRTIGQKYEVDNHVNLENSLKFGGSIGGHLMSGHIHEKGKVLEVEIIGDSKNIVIDLPKKWAKYVFEKGYIGINGCSITIGSINETRILIHLIPETLKSTNLDALVFGDEVNLEIDQNTIAIVDTTERVLRNQTK